MEIREVKELIDEVNKYKEQLLPIINGTISLATTLCETIDPVLQKVFIEKSVEYTTKKFNLLLKNKFSRKEALYIMTHDKEMLQGILQPRNTPAKTKKTK